MKIEIPLDEISIKYLTYLDKKVQFPYLIFRILYYFFRILPFMIIISLVIIWIYVLLKYKIDYIAYKPLHIKISFSAPTMLGFSVALIIFSKYLFDKLAKQLKQKLLIGDHIEIIIKSINSNDQTSIIDSAWTIQKLSQNINNLSVQIAQVFSSLFLIECCDDINNSEIKNVIDISSNNITNIETFDNNLPLIIFSKALIALKVGDLQIALENFKKYLDYYPDDKWVNEKYHEIIKNISSPNS